MEEGALIYFHPFFRLQIISPDKFPFVYTDRRNIAPSSTPGRMCRVIERKMVLASRIASEIMRVVIRVKRAQCSTGESDKRSLFAEPYRQQVRRVGCVRPLSLFYSDASADGVEERQLAPCSRSHARLRRNATMNHDFSFVQSAFIDL
ncbi:hypothetical protein EVAR_38614_1 [Eumeta japonica]|uniref:Uncharacterized protein n=1 Tax=Eumeta variegata TaxID=151549 RepID=A0A4C1WS14_EUMVA|nr:hypothetical protein EVAR_38614_1 [Eumeta japonica]